MHRTGTAQRLSRLRRGMATWISCNSCSPVEQILTLPPNTRGRRSAWHLIPVTSTSSDAYSTTGIQEGHKEVVTTLLAHGANPDYLSEALLTAITNPSIFSLLLSHNADPTGSLPKSNLLTYAVYSGNVDTLRMLLDHPKATELVMDSISAETQTKRR